MTTDSFPRPVIFSASTPEALLQHCESVLAQLGSADAETQHQAFLESSQNPALASEDARMGFITESLEQTQALLQEGLSALSEKSEEESWSLKKGVHYRKQALEAGKKVIAMFPGQGTQYVGMMKESRELPAIQAAIEGIDACFSKDGKSPLSETIYPAAAADKAQLKAQEAVLTETQNAQPAIGMVSVGLFKLLKGMGLQVDATVGHSFGELTALWAAGVFSDEDFFFLSKARGEAMAPPDDPNFDAGGMLAVRGDVEQVQKDIEEIPDIAVANLNSNNQVVLAGPKQAAADALEPLKAKGYKATLLKVAAAFHSKMVKHAQKPFAESIRSIELQTPQVPVYSNTTGQRYPEDPDAIRAILEDHILNSVLFKTEIDQAYEDGGHVFIEFGPKTVLTGLVSNILEGKPHVALALNPSPRKGSEGQWREAVLQLRLLGMTLEG